ncbi:MAG: efflux RND transporter permease subunit, partial [Rhodothermaceae bacterium]|nr:efflux RND transporter permease subunit [Rhodothermaceae bacterium]
MINRIIHFFLHNKLIAVLLFLTLAGWGIATAPFDWDLNFLPRNPVPVDAIPDLGDNQQIVFTEWPGRSPQDIEDQITYPLTTQLLGLPGVRTVRSNSMLGFSTINVIFENDVEFYWSRSRILEKLSSLPGGTLPDGVQPTLGPDATALGQIFWYTLEGYGPDGNPAGGWDLHE